MPIAPTPYAGNFLDKLFDVVSGLEQNRFVFNGAIHDDGLGVPTLGFGYALVVRGPVLWGVKGTLVADFQQLGIPFTPANFAVLTQIVRALNNNPQAAPGLVAQLAQTGPVINAATGRQLFDLESQRALVEIHDRFRDPRIIGIPNAVQAAAAGDALFALLTGSREMLAQDRSGRRNGSTQLRDAADPLRNRRLRRSRRTVFGRPGTADVAARTWAPAQHDRFSGRP
jgi:hypothetical protein